MQSSFYSEAGEGSLTCGVAMCTYNGIQYLAQQLTSLLMQNRMPDQVTIFDDCSDDGTWEYLQTWVAGVSIPVALHRNVTRQGVVKNFESATRTLNTDVIFLCDQDDVWLDSKIDLILKVFESDPNVFLVHTDAQLIDEGANDLGVSLFNALGLTQSERRRIQTGDAFSVLCRRNLVTGATAAFRRELLHLALPFPNCWLHDEWLAILAAATGRVVILDAPTIQYRQHARNVVGVAVPSFKHNMQRFFRLFRLSPGDFQTKVLSVRQYCWNDCGYCLPYLRNI
ncbi:glycosyltransferase family 2 protein [Undibacterium arcticum]|uniref:glycosyltransferase family 2 protein n=1 Tax=Undibacterium arcticum TaxID=1762892 RepID=UPI003608B619